MQTGNAVNVRKVARLALKSLVIAALALRASLIICLRV